MPLYMQIARRLEKAIVDESIPVGARLASEPKLSKDFGVSRATVRQAIQLLQREGRLVRIQGRGTFVVRPKMLLRNYLLGFSDEMRERGVHSSVRTLRQRLERSPESVARRLELPTGARVILLRRLYIANDEPVMVGDTYLPATMLAGLESEPLGSASLYRTLESKYGIKLANAEKEIEAISAPEEIATLLGIPPSTPLLRSTKRTFDIDGTTIEFFVGYWRADRYKFRVTEERHRENPTIRTPTTDQILASSEGRRSAAPDTG